MDADSADPSRSSGGRARPDLEEGEFVASDDESAGSDEDSGSVAQHLNGGGGGDDDARPEIEGRRLEGAVVDGGAAPSTTPSREPDSDETISDLEEGELVASSDDDSRSVVQQRHGGGGGEDDARPEIKGRGLEGVVVDEGVPPSATPSPSRERDSDGITSNVVDANAGAASPAQGLRFFPRPVCREAFSSEWAVHGHMRVHDPNGREQGSKERTPPMISSGWAVTAKRSSVRRRSSSSAEPNPTNPGVVHPPCSPQCLQGHQPAAPQVVVAQAQPTVAQAQPTVAEAAAPQFFIHHPSPPQVVEHHQQRPSSPDYIPAPMLGPAPKRWLCKVEGCGQRFATGAGLGGHMAGRKHGPRVSPKKRHAKPKVLVQPARDEQGFWLCKEKGCHQRFATHHGLGGHMTGHNKSRQSNEFAKPEKLSPCKHCPRVFTSAAKLSGHMRWTHPGKAIPKKRSAKPMVSAPELASALAPSVSMPPTAMEVAQAQPDAAPRVPGVLRLFGVSIVPGEPPASAAEQASSAVTETDQSSASSNNSKQ